MAQTNSNLSHRFVPILLGILLLGLVVWVTEWLIQTQQRSVEVSREIDVQADLFAAVKQIDGSLQSIFQLSIGMSSYIEAKGGEVDEAEVMALMKHLFDHGLSDHVRSFELIEGTTIRFVYPKSGNEAVLGVDLKQIPNQWPGVLIAMNSQAGTLSGPVDLIQGGQALVFRMPIRVKGQYWGVFNTVIDTESYLSEISIHPNGPFAVRAGNTLLVGDAASFTDDLGRRVDVSVPGGSWQVALVPRTADEMSFYMTLRFLGWATALLMGAALATILFQRSALQGLVLVDELTGVASRRQFDLMLEKFCQKYRRRDSGQFALLYVDLDHFKEINDGHGHRAGDFILVELAHRIRLAIRGGDLIARWGGDEFAIIVDNPSESSVARVVKRIRELVEQPVVWRDQPLQVRASIGMVQYPSDGVTPDALLSAAEQNMYAEKHSRHLKGKPNP